LIESQNSCQNAASLGMAKPSRFQERLDQAEFPVKGNPRLEVEALVRLWRADDRGRGGAGVQPMLTWDRLDAAVFITVVVVVLLVVKGMALEGILLALAVLGMAAAALIICHRGEDDET